MKKYTNRYTFSDGERELAILAKNETAARSNLGHADEYALVKTEQVPYERADWAQSILDSLGEDWDAEPINDEYTDTWFTFRRNDGLSFWSHWANWQEKRIEFSFDRPRCSKGRVPSVYGPNGNLVSPSITCALSKTGAQLAKDITRRLIPDCEAAQIICLEAVERDNAYYIKQAEAQAAADDLGEVRGLRFASNGSSVQISGYVKPDVAREIHRLLGGAK